jgi:hypothetical protein
MKYAIIHITFEHEKRVDDIIDKMITDNIGHLLDSNEYWGSETELETMAKTSDYVLQFNEDVAHIVDDYLYDMILWLLNTMLKCHIQLWMSVMLVNVVM